MNIYQLRKFVLSKHNKRQWLVTKMRTFKKALLINFKSIKGKIATTAMVISLVVPIVSGTSFGAEYEINTMDDFNNIKQYILDDLNRADTFTRLIVHDDMFDVFFDEFNQNDVLTQALKERSGFTLYNYSSYKSEIPSFDDDFVFSYNYTYVPLNTAQDLEIADAYIGSELLTKITPEMTEAEKVKVVFDLAVNTFIYGENGSVVEIRNIANGINGGGVVCQAYALFISRALDYLGIVNLFVTGDTTGDGQNDHLWNMVQVDGKWYHVDATWGDTPTGSYNPEFLLTTDSFMSMSRSWSGVPESDITPYNFIDEPSDDEEEPVDPEKPEEPGDDEEEPVDPETPEEPDDDEEEPVDPVTPEEPGDDEVEPVDPVTPEEPGDDEEEPVDPETPEEPGDDDEEPVDPETPEEPGDDEEEPVDPETPEEPGDDDEEPVYPETPDEPTQPTQPTLSGQIILIEDSVKINQKEDQVRAFINQTKVESVQRVETFRNALINKDNALAVPILDKSVMMVNGVLIKPDVKALVVLEDRVIVPVKFIADSLGFKVLWLQGQGAAKAGRVVLEKDGTQLIIDLNSNTAYINGTSVKIDKAPMIRNGRTYLSIESIIELLETSVEIIDNNDGFEIKFGEIKL